MKNPGTVGQPGRRARLLCESLSALYFAARRDYDIDLTHRAIRVLQFVAFREDAPRIDDVARFLGCAPSTASELLKRLQTKGLLLRTRSKSDERVVRLTLTPAGQEALVQHTSLDPGKIQSALGALPAGDQETLLGLMQAITERVDAPADPAEPSASRPRRSTTGKPRG